MRTKQDDLNEDTHKYNILRPFYLFLFYILFIIYFCITDQALSFPTQTFVPWEIVKSVYRAIYHTS